MTLISPMNSLAAHCFFRFNIKVSRYWIFLKFENGFHTYTCHNETKIAFNPILNLFMPFFFIARVTENLLNKRNYINAEMINNDNKTLSLPNLVCAFRE